MSNHNFPPMPRDRNELAKEMFEAAIAAGFLSMDPQKKNYAHHYMYMGIECSKALFKHINLRVYINIHKDLLE